MADEKRTVKDVLAKLEKFLDENKFTSFRKKSFSEKPAEVKMVESLRDILENIPALNELLNSDIQRKIKASTVRADEILSNRKMFFEIMNSSIALAATCQKSVKDTGNVDSMLVAKIISVIIAKMENEGLIKINI